MEKGGGFRDALCPPNRPSCFSLGHEPVTSSPLCTHQRLMSQLSQRSPPCSFLLTLPSHPLHPPTLPAPAPSDTRKGPPAEALPAGQTVRPAEHKGWANSSSALLSGRTVRATVARQMQGGSLHFAMVLLIVVADKATMHTAEVHDMQECTIIQLG